MVLTIDTGTGAGQVVHVLATDALKWKWFTENVPSFVAKGKVRNAKAPSTVNTLDTTNDAACNEQHGVCKTKTTSVFTRHVYFEASTYTSYVRLSTDAFP